MKANNGCRCWLFCVSKTDILIVRKAQQPTIEQNGKYRQCEGVKFKFIYLLAFVEVQLLSFAGRIAKIVTSDRVVLASLVPVGTKLWVNMVKIV